MKLKKKMKKILKWVLNKLSIKQNKIIFKRIKYFILLRLSSQFIAQNNFKKATHYWGNALFLNLEAKYDDNDLKKVFYTLSKNEEMYTYLQELEKHVEQEVHIYFSALVEIINRNNVQAINFLKRIVSINRHSYYKDSLFRLLKLLEKENRNEEFWIYFQLYKEMHPKANNTYFIQSKYFYNKSLWNECILATEHLLKKKKHIDHSFRYLITCLIQTGRLEEASNYLTENTYNIEEYTIYHLWGVYYYNTLNYAEAIKFFNLAIHSHPHTNKTSIRWLAKAYKNDQKQNEAENLFNTYKDYMKEEVFTLNLAKSAGLLIYIEERLEVHIKDNEVNFETTEWFIKYLLENRYWGRAYTLVQHKSIREYSSDFLLKTKQDLEEKFSHINIDIKKDFEENKQIEQYMSSELIVDEILSKTKQLPEKMNHCKKIKRIALVLTSLGPGGAERQCVNLLNGLIKKIQSSEIEDVKLFVTSLSRSDRESFYLDKVIDKSKVIEFYDRKRVIQIDEVPILDSFSTIIPLIQPETRKQALIYLTKHLNEFQPDVIHGFQNEAILNSFLVGSILQTPSLFGRWGSMPPTVSRNLSVMQKRNVEYMHWAYKTIENEVKNKIFSTNSQMAARSYEEWIEADMLSVYTIYNGLNLENLVITRKEEELKTFLNIDNDALIVGSIFRISDEKRPFLWADIAREVNQRYSKRVHFILVGDGPLMSELSEYVKKNGLSEYIHLVGRQEDVANWYNIMNIFILTSAVEGIANAMLEAEYIGIPVIVPDVGGLKEAVVEGVTGYVLEDDSKENFTATIIQTLEKEWCTKEREFSKQYIKEKFSIPTMVEKTLDCYHKNLGIHH